MRWMETTAGLLIACAAFPAAMHAQDAKPEPDMTFSARVGDENIRFEVNGGNVNIEVNGRAMPSERIVRRGNSIRALSTSGDAVATLNLHNNGGTIRTMPQRRGSASLGVKLSEIDDAVAAHLDLDPKRVIAITSVAKGRAAAKAGLEKHDIITRIEGKAPATRTRLTRILAKKKPGDSLALTFMRRGVERQIDVVLGRGKAHAASSPSYWNTALSQYQVAADPFGNLYGYSNDWADIAKTTSSFGDARKLDDYAPWLYAQALKQINDPTESFTNIGPVVATTIDAEVKALVEKQIQAVEKRLDSLEALMQKIERKL